MSALPCPMADPFAAADKVYATISEFLRSEEARQVKHSELERQLEGMGRDLLGNCCKRIWTCASRARRSNRCGMPRARRSRPPRSMGAVWRASSERLK